MIKHPGILKTRRPRHKINQTEILDGRVVVQSQSIATGDEREPRNVEPQTMQWDSLQLDQNLQKSRKLKPQLEIEI
jgi:hypothetical protein